MEEMQEQIKRKDEKIASLERRTVTLENRVTDLEYLEQYSRMNDVIITGLNIKPRSYARAVEPEGNGDAASEEKNASSTERQVAAFMESNGIILDTNNIEACHILPKKRVGTDTRRGIRPKETSVILRFVNRKHKLVQCSDPGLSSVPINVPADTVKLRLEKTLISRVPRAAFYNLSELRFLWLTFNSITSVHPSSFVNLKALRELRLDGNLLTTFPWEGLRDMPHLQTLGLHNNRLSSLPAHAALFLHNITYLDLSSNRLTILPAEFLDLWFPLPGLQEGPVQRKILGLHDNPWLCDCQISMLTSLSMSFGSSVVLMDQLLMCSRSLGQSGMLLTQAELSRCMRLSVKPAATGVVSPLGSNVILRCDASGYPTPTLTWIKTSSSSGEHNMENKTVCLNVPVMQESPRVGVRWSIISLNGISYKDAGEYRCQARNMAGTSEAPIKLKGKGESGKPCEHSPPEPPRSPCQVKGIPTRERQDQPRQSVAFLATPRVKGEPGASRDRALPPQAPQNPSTSRAKESPPQE
ncbi:leucine-rich repeat, immunoglobulin-like domain and transmembrane domain-containing protein 3b [Odontesthes bonariensis]|uniref:leucine-rich repeat, immunoglobulin-like domain and transmembrane domain-containing protein 3b n=1 Tax=Odontesthes bonariensis TaxID=219752 RepID=UPI003F585DA9